MRYRVKFIDLLVSPQRFWLVLRSVIPSKPFKLLDTPVLQDLQPHNFPFKLKINLHAEFAMNPVNDEFYMSCSDIRSKPLIFQGSKNSNRSFSKLLRGS